MKSSGPIPFGACVWARNCIAANKSETSTANNANTIRNERCCTRAAGRPRVEKIIATTTMPAKQTHTVRFPDSHAEMSKQGSATNSITIARRRHGRLANSSTANSGASVTIHVVSKPTVR